MPNITDTNRHWWILGAASCILGLVVLDETVVGVALPTMRADLRMSEVASHWVVNAYLLTFTCFVAVGGRLGDMLGRRLVFPCGAAIFALGSVLAGAAPTGGWLIAARALQGVGAAITFPASMAMITQTFPPERRGVAFATQTTIAGCFMASGPLVGGFFSEIISWRWIFWINLPVIAATVIVILAALTPEGGTGRSRSGGGLSDFAPGSFDYAGLIALVAGLTGIIVALMQSSDWGWSASGTITLLAGGLIATAAFVVIELRRSMPLIELDLLAIPTFTGGNLIFAVFQFEKMAVFIFVALYLQHGLGRSPIEAGLMVTVAILPTLVTSRIAGRLRDAYGPRKPLIVTLLVTAVALFSMGLATMFGSLAAIVGILIVWGAFMPGIAVPLRPALMGAVPPEKQGQASGMNLSIQMLGGTFGIALCSVLLASTSVYWPIFAVTGAATLLAALIGWAMVERPAAAKSPA